MRVFRIDAISDHHFVEIHENSELQIYARQIAVFEIQRAQRALELVRPSALVGIGAN